MPTLSHSALLATAALIAQPAAAQTQSTSPARASPNPASTTSVGTGASDDAPEIIVTARHKAESSQAVPLAVSVIGGDHIDNTGAFNVGRLQQLTPTLQFYSSNPRNSSVNIRGIGAPVGLTNDGIEQGVGIYVDDVYSSRVAIRNAGVSLRSCGDGAACDSFRVGHGLAGHIKDICLATNTGSE